MMMQGNKSKGGMVRASSRSSSSSSFALFFSRLYRGMLLRFLRKRFFFSGRCRRNDPALPVNYAINGTCAVLLGFVKLQLVFLPLIIVAHTGPVSQSAPKLTESSALLLGSGVADRGLGLALVFILAFLVTVCD